MFNLDIVVFDSSGLRKNSHRPLSFLTINTCFKTRSSIMVLEVAKIMPRDEGGTVLHFQCGECVEFPR